MITINKHEHEIVFNHKSIFEEMGFDMCYPPKGKELRLDPIWGQMFNQWVKQNGIRYRLEAITVDGEKKIAVYSINNGNVEDKIYIFDFVPVNIELAHLFLRS